MGYPELKKGVFLQNDCMQYLESKLLNRFPTNVQQTYQLASIDAQEVFLKNVKNQPPFVEKNTQKSV